MKFMSAAPDGGQKSTVQGFWLFEIKPLFSVVLLKFNPGTRENYHSHAFNALTWFVKGNVIEYHLNGDKYKWGPSFIPKYTPRNCFHKVFATEPTYALSFRGAWDNTWKEYDPVLRKFITLTHGRKEV